MCGEPNAKDFAERIILAHMRNEKHTVQCTIDIKKVLHSSGTNMFIIERGESKDRVASVALIYGEDYRITTQSWEEPALCFVVAVGSTVTTKQSDLAPDGWQDRLKPTTR